MSHLTEVPLPLNQHCHSVCVSVFLCVYACMLVFTCVYACMRVCLYSRVCVYVCVCALTTYCNYSRLNRLPCIKQESQPKGLTLYNVIIQLQAHTSRTVKPARPDTGSVYRTGGEKKREEEEEGEEEYRPESQTLSPDSRTGPCLTAREEGEKTRHDQNRYSHHSVEGVDCCWHLWGML